MEQAPALPTGSSVQHNDLRPDNIILDSRSGRAWICDWNYLATGPAWADWVALLPYAHHDGLDADALLRGSTLSVGVPDDAVDSWLALLAAYMVVSGGSPEVPTSPHLRAHGRFTARIVIDWLSERRKRAA
ncbi:phosphotransferase [Arthrobacter echini]|uniref:phosphotransferase n=1 Tax=Arthrobacter echini TaxID=1529066 RepID=UPI001FE33352|nr:phosphotransferase [Arthrobacter echini]